MQIYNKKEIKDMLAATNRKEKYFMVDNRVFPKKQVKQLIASLKSSDIRFHVQSNNILNAVWTHGYMNFRGM